MQKVNGTLIYPTKLHLETLRVPGAHLSASFIINSLAILSCKVYTVINES